MEVIFRSEQSMEQKIDKEVFDKFFTESYCPVDYTTVKEEFMQINATSAGKKDMEEVVAAAKNNQGMYGKCINVVCLKKWRWNCLSLLS